MRKVLFVVWVLLSVFFVKAQTAIPKPLKIAVFAPVYLDSVFTGDTYKSGKANLPRYILSGLDFYNGVMLAVDSLDKEKVLVEVLFYDSKSLTGIERQLADTAMQDVSLIIASFNNREEMKPLADFALQNRVLLVSATYPNDGGIKENPFFVMLNPTLTAHLEALFKYIRRYYPLDNITVFRKKGNVEDMIGSVFENLNKTTAGSRLKLRTVELSDSFSTYDVVPYLDSTRQNIIICGTLSEAFGINLSKALGNHTNYRTLALGMPTWDGLRDISKDLEVVYSTPYNLGRTDKISLRLADRYRTKLSGRPSDMVFKGFESMYHFTKLLLKYGSSLPAHLSDKEYKIFNDFNIQPVQTNGVTDYLENRKLYFIRKKDGMVRSVN